MFTHEIFPSGRGTMTLLDFLHNKTYYATTPSGAAAATTTGKQGGKEKNVVKQHNFDDNDDNAEVISVTAHESDDDFTEHDHDEEETDDGEYVKALPIVQHDSDSSSSDASTTKSYIVHPQLTTIATANTGKANTKGHHPQQQQHQSTASLEDAFEARPPSTQTAAVAAEYVLCKPKKEKSKTNTVKLPKTTATTSSSRDKKYPRAAVPCANSDLCSEDRQAIWLIWSTLQIHAVEVRRMDDKGEVGKRMLRKLYKWNPKRVRQVLQCPPEGRGGVLADMARHILAYKMGTVCTNILLEVRFGTCLQFVRVATCVSASCVYHISLLLTLGLSSWMRPSYSVGSPRCY